MRAAIALVILNAVICAAQSAEPAQQASAPQSPTFRAEARQVVLALSVWNKGADYFCYPYPQTDEDIRKCFPTGLSSSLFHVFENGIAQKINYFAEVDPRQYGNWVSQSTTGGIWWIVFTPAAHPVPPPFSTYLIGYVPPSLKPGECRAIAASVDRHSVYLHRDRYCQGEHSDALDPATLEGTPLGSQLREFAKSAERDSMNVSAQAFVFRSTGVLSFETDTEALKPTAPSAPEFKFVVEVRDEKAPAMVQLAVEFGPAGLPQAWTFSECEKHAALHVLGAVYRTNGEVAAQFGDTFTCRSGDRAAPFDWSELSGFWFPSRFDTQLELPAGDYQLRVVVSDHKGHFGRAVLPLHVPRFDGRRLTMSDVSLSPFVRNKAAIAKDAAEISPAPLIPTPLVSKSLQYVPARGIGLKKHNPAFLYFEIYEPLLEKEKAPVYFRMKITDVKTGAVVLEDPPMSAAEWIIPGSVVVPVGLKFTAGSKLKKGSYRLEVQALDAAGQQSGWQSVDFSIR